jgi:hypothetical protein
MLETALLGLGGSIASGLFGMQSAQKARKAARIAGQENDRLISEGNSIYQSRVPDIVARFDPWSNAGSAAVNEQSSLMGLGGAQAQQEARGRFQTDPGYQFQMNEGLGAVDSRAASRGMLGSGAAIKDTLRFSQGLADQSYGNYFNRLGGLSQQGLAATGQQTGLLNQAAMTELTSRQARGAGHLGAAQMAMPTYQQEANAFGGMLQNGIGALGSLAGNQSAYGGSGSPMNLLSNVGGQRFDVRGSSFASQPMTGLGMMYGPT